MRADNQDNEAGRRGMKEGDSYQRRYRSIKNEVKYRARRVHAPIGCASADCDCGEARRPRSSGSSGSSRSLLLWVWHVQFLWQTGSCKDVAGHLTGASGPGGDVGRQVW